MQRIQLEGTRCVRNKGAYRVLWRIQLSDDYWLGNVEFITCVKRSKNKKNFRRDSEIFGDFTKFAEKQKVTPLQEEDFTFIDQSIPAFPATPVEEILKFVRTRSQKKGGSSTTR